MTAAPVALPEGPAPQSSGLRRWLTSPVGAQVTAAVVFIGAWQLLTLIAPRVPSPIDVANFLYVEITGGSHGGIVRGEFFEHFAITLQRFSLGLLLGFVSGLLVGILIGSSSLARALLNDTVLVLLTMPAFVWAFLTTMWFGITWQAPVLTVAFAAFITLSSLKFDDLEPDPRPASGFGSHLEDGAVVGGRMGMDAQCHAASFNPANAAY